MVVATTTPQEIYTHKPARPLNSFKNIDLEAKSAFVEELNSGTILFEKESVRKLPLASLTKIMTALLITETLDPKEVITITYEDLLTEGESGLSVGEKWHMKDLRDFMLLVSSNDAATALARHAGAKLKENELVPVNLSDLNYFIFTMNSRARELKMTSTEFSNPTGLDLDFETRPGAIGTTRDISHLMRYIAQNYPEILEITTNGSESISSLSGHHHETHNTNGITGFLPNLLASKTGYTLLAGGNLTVVIDPGLGNPVIITVLGSSREGRFEDVQKLAEQLTR